MTRNKLKVSIRTDFEIKFVEDRTNGYLILFAIVELALFRGKIHDELMFAEIFEDHSVRWEDKYMEPVPCTSLKEAKEHVLKNYHSHEPHSNGGTYDKDMKPFSI